MCPRKVNVEYDAGSAVISERVDDEKHVLYLTDD